jgi:mRNA-degrading endonuclease RelE of RelBE toxin-antitoxin system
MNIVMTQGFKKSMKKLHKNQKQALDDAIQDVMKDVEKGTLKKGDLKGVQVHKFKMVGQLTLLAYTYEEGIVTLTLLKFGSHENFYRDMKR